MASRALRAAARLVLTPLVAIGAPIFALAARARVGADLCRRFGFQPVRVHFYEPIPEYESVPDRVFTEAQSFPGLRIDRDIARAALERLAPWGAEARWPDAPEAPGTYYCTNEHFGFSSAALLHGVIRAHGTRKIIEVGGGYSSLVSIAALKRSHGEDNFEFVSIEPYPSPWLREVIARSGTSVRLLDVLVQQLDVDLLTDLQAGDILFIDSSHNSKLASDVNFLFLQVLPRLRPGVLVHVHDIYLPYEYPRKHFFGPHKMYWNEQYMLAALLTGSSQFEVFIPGYLVQSEMQADFARTFPAFDPKKHRKTSSFWLRRVE